MRPSFRPLSRAAAAVAVFVALATAACAAASDSPSPAAVRTPTPDRGAGELLQRAITALERGDTHRLEATNSLLTVVGGQGQKLEMTVNGDAVGAARGAFTGSFTGQPPDSRFALTVIDNEQFFRPPDGEWRRLPPGITLPTGPTPLDLIAFMRGASGAITDRGVETVGGAPARRLAFNLDPRKVREELERRGRPIADLQFNRARMDLWVAEASGQPVRGEALLEARVPNGGSVTLELKTLATEYGKAVDVQPPASYTDADLAPAPSPAPAPAGTPGG